MSEVHPTLTSENIENPWTWLDHEDLEPVVVSSYSTQAPREKFEALELAAKRVGGVNLYEISSTEGEEYFTGNVAGEKRTVEPGQVAYKICIKKGGEMGTVEARAEEILKERHALEAQRDPRD